MLEKGDLRAEFTVLYPANDSIRQALALSVAEMIKPIGIQANVEGKSWDEIEPMMHSNAVIFGWGRNDPTEMYTLHHSKTAQGSYANAGCYANSQIDNVLDLAMGAPSEEEALPSGKQHNGMDKRASQQKGMQHGHGW